MQKDVAHKGLWDHSKKGYIKSSKRIHQGFQKVTQDSATQEVATIRIAISGYTALGLQKELIVRIAIGGHTRECPKRLYYRYSDIFSFCY